MSRKAAREHIFKVLFQLEFGEVEEFEEAIKEYMEQNIFQSNTDLTDDEKSFIINESKGVREHLQEIDAKIEAHALGWKLARMAKVDLTILRLAIYELEYEPSIPTGVAINEAVDLAKKYSTDASPSFVNGVLAKIVE